jgi:ferredoxin
MKVVVDYDLCEANAVCMRILPEVFQVDDQDNLNQDNLNVLIEHPPEAMRAKLKEAVRLCPRQAISIAEE